MEELGAKFEGVTCLLSFSFVIVPFSMSLAVVRTPTSVDVAISICL